MARPGGLGKGLGALIPAAEATKGTGLDEISVTLIDPNPHQPRDHFDDAALASLADSIRELGVLQPILVRPKGERYELIAGERRWRAARKAGLSVIPAIVRSTDDAGSLQQAIVENIQREELNPLEEAAAYQQLVDEFDLTHEAIAESVGRSRASVSNTIRLLQLPAAVQRHIKKGNLRMGHARALLGTPDRGLQEQLAGRIVKDGMSVRAVEAAVREDPTATPKAPTPDTKLRPPGLLELEQLLGDFLETSVYVTMGPKRGKVTIDFADLADLERIYRSMRSE